MRCLSLEEALLVGMLLLPSFPLYHTQACLGSAVASQNRVGVVAYSRLCIYCMFINIMFPHYSSKINFLVHVLAQ